MALKQLILNKQIKRTLSNYSYSNLPVSYLTFDNMDYLSTIKHIHTQSDESYIQKSLVHTTEKETKDNPGIAKGTCEGMWFQRKHHQCLWLIILITFTSQLLRRIIDLLTAGTEQLHRIHIGLVTQTDRKQTLIVAINS